MTRDYSYLRCHESIHLFLDKHQYLELPLLDCLLGLNNSRSVHNHTVQNLYLYFDLQKHIDKKRVFFYPGCVFIVDNRKYKWFIFDLSEFPDYFDISLFDISIHKKILFYSSFRLKNDLLVESKLKECVYNLEEVFNEDTYRLKYKSKASKKIYNKIKYPLRYLQTDKFRVEDITEQHLDVIESLHKDWCNFKLNDPKVFKMMFSSNRYNRCIRESLVSSSEVLSITRFFRKAFYWENRLIAVRLCLLVNKTSYDIAFFSRFWDVPSNLILYINTWCLKSLKEDYRVDEHNCGMQLDKNLEMSKHHFPNQTRITYKYNFIKTW